jgi:predicted nucleic acid-binding protein
MDGVQGGAAGSVIVIADTSPLNYLIQLGLVEYLPDLYDEIVIPQSVLQELSNLGSPLVVRDWAYSSPDWVIVRSVGALDPTLPPRLGAGEREAISLAIELHAGMLLIDDLPGRNAAEERGLSITGTLTILLQISLLSGIDFETKLAELVQLGFRASESILERIREAFLKNRQSGSL